MSLTIIGILAIVSLILGVVDGLPPQKIVGGSPALFGEFPYQVSLRYDNEHICGGAIISELHIITAAHCVININHRQLRIATRTISVTDGQIHDVKRVVINAEYDHNDSGSPNDIAIIILEESIKFDKNQNKIDLPTEATPGGVNAIATGWGHVSSKIHESPVNLRKVDMKTMSKIQCENMYGKENYILETQICAYSGTRGRGTCKGDSGGPLASDGHLIGIVSWGVACAVGLPDVFTSVYHQLNWINRIINTTSNE